MKYTLIALGFIIASVLSFNMALLYTQFETNTAFNLGYELGKGEVVLNQSDHYLVDLDKVKHK
jgi:hypothetical protein